ncbi:MAG: DUF268 domain-containing protein [Butyrivibrio sp.]|nr:DUF268 domain-containing protein [Butyrivibrio sp.]
MAEVTFWTSISNDNAKDVLQKLRRVMEIFYNKEDIEILVIKASGFDCDDISTFEQEYTENVILVDVEQESMENAQDIMLEYANGFCFLEIDDAFSFGPDCFDKLLYDANICDEDTFKYIRNKYTYILMGNGDKSFSYDKSYEHKCLADYRENAGSIDTHYFYQDIYVASKVRELGIRHIYDIGSRIDGYISHLLSMDIAVTMIDVRPLDYIVKGLDFIQGNATELSDIGDSSLEYLSCLHALEHFGLGRYGDPMDYYGWKRALEQYKRVLKQSGILILSVPVGKTERVCFNAHRIFNPATIVNELNPEMSLLEFTCIHDTRTTTLDFVSNRDYEKMQNVLDEYTRNKLGEYDCGIFVFERC